MKIKQILSWIIFLLFGQFVVSETSNSTEKQDLSLAEAKNGELEIIKSIKKINDDGSYTIGYEADDGSFKIESRDVLGNIKGTYGYLDENGAVKRISYTTNNTTDTNTDTIVEAPSVVQRIPSKGNKTSPNSNKPSILLYNPTTPLTVDLSQEAFSKPSTESESKIKTASKENSKSKEVVKSSTSRTNIVYATSSPSNVIFASRSQTRAQKSEGQILRPEVIARRTTELPAYRRGVSKQYGLEDESSTPKTRSTLLRRQLVSENPIAFDPRKHIENLEQSVGNDAVDVYSASISTATPRPLFTTTYRPRILSTIKPGIESLMSRNLVQRVAATTTEFSQNPTTSATSASTTPAPVHEQLIRENQPFYQLKNPYNERVVLVPINQVNSQMNEQYSQPRHQPQPQPQPQPQLYFANGQYYKAVRTTSEPPQYQEQVPQIILRRPQVQKSIPIQVEPSGYAPQPQPRVTPVPYPLFLPATTPPPNYDIKDVENDVSYIKPPVSTNDFQKIIEYLILRQTKLEQANALINAQRERELLNLRKHRSHSTPIPLFVRRPQEIIQNGPVTFIADPQMARSTHYITAPQMQVEHQGQYARNQMEKNQNSYDDYPSTSNSYTPTRRVARLLPPNPPKDNYENENFLPPQIREMLLLRMLQLAINPSLPLDTTGSESIQDSTPAEQQIRKHGVRNVEVLGEEVNLNNLRTE